MVVSRAEYQPRLPQLRRLALSSITPRRAERGRAGQCCRYERQNAAASVELICTPKLLYPKSAASIAAAGSAGDGRSVGISLLPPDRGVVLCAIAAAFSDPARADRRLVA